MSVSNANAGNVTGVGLRGASGPISASGNPAVPIARVPKPSNSYFQFETQRTSVGIDGLNPLNPLATTQGQMGILGTNLPTAPTNAMGTTQPKITTPTGPSPSANVATTIPGGMKIH